MQYLYGLFSLLLAGAASAQAFPPVDVERINDRVYAMLGPSDVPNKENRGYVNNVLVIVGDRGVVLVDAGSYKAVAAHIDKAIKTVTDKPITHVLITHHHADHHLGLEYFTGAKVISTEFCAEQIANGGRSFANFMQRNSGSDLSAARTVVPRTRIGSPSRKSLVLDGVNIELIAPNTAHTHGDMMVWLPDDGVLASGDILVHGINPNFRDGNLKSWIEVVDNDILTLPLKTVMPGHGPLMSRDDVVAFRDLIAEFYGTVEQIYTAGGEESEVRKQLDLAKWEKLGRYQDMMGGNINKVWLEVEQENF